MRTRVDHAVPVADLRLTEQPRASGTRDCPRVRAASANPATNGSRIQTGLPSAPARWATAVSTVITRSRRSTAAAVSAKSASSGRRRWQAAASLAARARSASRIIALQADEIDAGHDQAAARGARARSCGYGRRCASACPTRPGRRAGRSACRQPLRHFCAHAAGGAQIGHARPEWSRAWYRKRAAGSSAGNADRTAAALRRAR